jgi:hypothetical protein
MGMYVNTVQTLRERERDCMNNISSSNEYNNFNPGIIIRKK